MALWAKTCTPVILDLLLSNIAPIQARIEQKRVTSHKFEFEIMGLMAK